MTSETKFSNLEEDVLRPLSSHQTQQPDGIAEQCPHLGHISDTEFQSYNCKDFVSRAQQTLTEAVKDILNTQPEYVSVNRSGVSNSDYQVLRSSTAKDLQKVASEISAEIVQSKNSLDSQANVNCWKVVEERLKAFSFCKYVKESILMLWSALTTKYNRRHSSNQEEGLQKVLETGELLVESMSKVKGGEMLDEMEARPELFQNVVNNFNTDKHKEICGQLSDIIFQHLGPKRSMKKDIIKHVDVFMKDMYKYAQAQAQQQMDHDVVKLALERIEEATDNLYLSSPSLSKDTTEETLSSESEEDEECSCLTSVDPFEEWDNVSNHLALQITSHILGNLLPHVPASTLSSIISKMKMMLMKEFEDLDIPFRITEEHIRITVKAVLKELRKKMGNKGWIRINFVLGKQYDLIIKSIVRHLLKSQKKKSFTQVFRAKLGKLTDRILKMVQTKSWVA